MITDDKSRAIAEAVEHKSNLPEITEEMSNAADMTPFSKPKDVDLYSPKGMWMVIRDYRPDEEEREDGVKWGDPVWVPMRIVNSADLAIRAFYHIFDIEKILQIDPDYRTGEWYATSFTAGEDPALRDTNHGDTPAEAVCNLILLLLKERNEGS